MALTTVVPAHTVQCTVQCTYIVDSTYVYIYIHNYAHAHIGPG